MTVDDLLNSAFAYSVRYGIPGVALGGVVYLRRRATTAARLLLAAIVIYLATTALFHPAHALMMEYARIPLIRNWILLRFVFSLFFSLAIGLVLAAAWSGRVPPAADES